MIRTVAAFLGAGAALASPASGQDIDALKNRFEQRPISASTLPTGFKPASLCAVRTPDLAADGPWHATTAFRLAYPSDALATLADGFDPAARGDVAFTRPGPSGEATYTYTSIPDLPPRTIRPIAFDDLDLDFAGTTGKPLQDLLADAVFIDIAGCEAADLPIFAVFIGTPPDPEPFGYLIFATEGIGYQVSTTGPGGIQGEDRGYVTTLFMR